MSIFRCFLALLLLVSQVRSAITNLIDFTTAPDFSALRTCGHCCLCAGGASCNATNQCITTSIGCPTNTCVCSPGTLTLAKEYLDSCVRTSCGSQTDVESYGQVFAAYCKDILLASLSTLTTSSTTTPTTTVSVLPSGSAASSKDSSSVTTQLAIPLGVGLGVGIPAFLVALFGVCITIKNQEKRKYAAREAVRNLEDAERWRSFQDRVAQIAPGTPARALLGTA